MANISHRLEMRPKKTKKHVRTGLGAACSHLVNHAKVAKEKSYKVKLEAVKRPATPEEKDHSESSPVTPPAALRKLSAIKKEKKRARSYQSSPSVPASIRSIVNFMPDSVKSLYQAHIKVIDDLNRKHQPRLAEIIVCRRRRQLLIDGLNEFLIDCLKASTLPANEKNLFGKLSPSVQVALDDMEAYMIRRH